MTIINLKKINKAVETLHELEGVHEEFLVMQTVMDEVLEILNEAETKRFCEITGTSITQNKTENQNESM